MSLINDALKRTKDVQQQTPAAASGPALRPVDPAEAKAGGGAKTLLFIMVLAVILGNFLLWMAFKDRGEQKPTVPATERGVAAAVPSVPPEVAVEPATTSVPAVPPEPAPIATPPVEATAPAIEEPAISEVATNAPEPKPAVVFADPPKPTVLRLQSIIYSSTRPSAMIGGKFLHLGDRIQGHQVVAIDKNTVTLVGEGQTNVLSLP